MPLQLFTAGFYLIAFFAGIYLFNGLIHRFFKSSIISDSPILGMSILKSGIFISSGFLLYATIAPIQQLSILLKTTLSGNDLILKQLSYCSLFWIISFLVLIGLATLTYLLLILIMKGRKPEMEIANGDIGTALMFIAVLVSLVIGLSPLFSGVLDSLLPYPDVPLYR